MVSDDVVRQSAPAYPLDQVRAAARAGAIDYGGKKVIRDIENLGYAPEDVQHCLTKLTTRHFKESVRYGAFGPWLDVYRVSCNHPGGVVDRLYIKLKLVEDRLLVVLQSFHR